MRSGRKILREMFTEGEDGTERYGEPKNEGPESLHGLRVTGDKATLGALQDALHQATDSEAPDLVEWCEQAWKAVAKGLHSGNVTLPPFSQTPDVDSFNDDQGLGPDSEEY